MRRFTSALLLSLLLISFARAETIVTEGGHFRVHYTSGARETAKEVAIVAQDVWYQLVTAFQLHEEFSPIDILVTDNIDVGNGYADYYQNQVVIWATNLNYPLRGTHRWLRDVVAHELGHVFSLKLAKLYPFRFGLLQASVVNSSKADMGFSVPIYSLVTPSWWVEGVAQYESWKSGGDWWDSNRDMLLRTATIENDLLSYDDMGVFAHNWLKSEMVYNQGFALCRYIGERFGEDKPRELAVRTGHVTFNTALKDVIGIRGRSLYRDWTDHLQAKYADVVDSVGPVNEGMVIADDGTYDWSPVISPDGTRLAYVTNHGEDYLLTQPRIVHLPSGQVQKIKERIYGDVAWFPDGGKVVYTKFGRGTLFLDLYVYDLVSETEQRISSHLRAKDASVSPDGEWISFVSTDDGGNKLGMVRADGSELRWLTNDRRSESKGGGSLGDKTNHLVQIHTPRWSPDGNQIIFSIFKDIDRDIAVIGTDGPYFSVRDALSDSAAFPDTVMHPETAQFRVLASTTADERDPTWLPDGSGFLYSANHGGIFNIYRHTFADSATQKLTNVLGGAFRPDVAPDGKWFTYVGYHANNFSAYSMALGSSGPRLADASNVIRSYQHIESEPSAKELFHVGGTIPMKTLVGWVPRVRLGPNLVGDEFTVNHLGAGVAAQVNDQATGRMYYADVEYTKNLQNEDPPSFNALGFVQQQLRPIKTTEWTLSPSVYAIGSYYQLGLVRDRGQRTDILDEVEPNSGLDDNGNTIPLSRASEFAYEQVRTDWSDYYHIQGGFGAGLGWGRNQINTQLVWRRYRLAQDADLHLYNRSKVIDGRDNLSDVTGSYPWADIEWPEVGKPILLSERQTLFDMRYFDDRMLGVSYSHSRMTPTVDASVNPTGGHSISFSYRLHHVTLTDSLAESGLDVDGDGIPDLHSITADIYQSSLRNMTIHEIVMSMRQHIRMPGPLKRHSLVLFGVVGYMDQPLKYNDREDPTLNLYEGWAYYPLRYRLGGAGSLRGYPYFSHEGSKMGFFRASYVFPIIGHWGAQFANLYHDRTYGAFFVEGGSTWNWDRISEAKFFVDDFLWDVGFELRTSMYAFYRLPISGYAVVAWRQKDVPRPFVEYVREDGNYVTGSDGLRIEDQPDDRRIYIGLSFGVGGGGHHPSARKSGSHVYHGAISRPRQFEMMSQVPGEGVGEAGGFWSPITGTPQYAVPTSLRQ
jgi:hypothetical protein